MAPMDLPFNMTAPRAKLEDGEEIVLSAPGLRRKGWFGNRFGELHLTDRRVVFVKAIMKGPVAAVVGAKGARPMLAFDRKGVTAEKVALKKQTALQLTGGGVTEKIVMAEAKVDEVLAQLRAS